MFQFRRDNEEGKKERRKREKVLALGGFGL
jgi:hypothetical protein